MSSGRVLATPEARSAVQQLKAIVTGDLTSTISNLERQGDILNDPNQWDGTLAGQFRGTWTQHKADIRRIQTALQELQAQVDRITTEIMTAGGNAA